MRTRLAVVRHRDSPCRRSALSSKAPGATNRASVQLRRKHQSEKEGIAIRSEEPEKGQAQAKPASRMLEPPIASIAHCSCIHRRPSDLLLHPSGEASKEVHGDQTSYRLCTCRRSQFRPACLQAAIHARVNDVDSSRPSYRNGKVMVSMMADSTPLV